MKCSRTIYLCLPNKLKKQYSVTINVFAITKSNIISLKYFSLLKRYSYYKAFLLRQKVCHIGISVLNEKYLNSLAVIQKIFGN